MTDKIVEARERALCWLKHTQSKGWCRCVSADACLPTMREMFRDQVAATLAADRAAGYWLAPNEPDEAMLKAAEADEDDWRFMPHPKDRYARHFEVMRDAFLRAPEQPMREFRDTCHGKTEEHP